MVPSGSTPARAEPNPPAAAVEAHAVVHPGTRLRVSVPEAAAYAGGERFILYDVADCELHVFVEADAARRLRRLWWVQFEAYLPGRPELRYDYGARDRRLHLWGAPAWAATAFGPTDAAPRPGSDRARVEAILAAQGLTAPPEMMSARLVRLLDDPQGTGSGRAELMLIHAEDIALIDATAADFSFAGRGTSASWKLQDAALIERAIESFWVDAPSR